MKDRKALELQQAWESDDRWTDVVRPYSAADVVRLRGAVKIEYSLARMGAERLWRLLRSEPYIRASAPKPGPRRCKWCKPGSRRFMSAAGKWPAT